MSNNQHDWVTNRTQMGKDIYRIWFIRSMRKGLFILKKKQKYLVLKDGYRVSGPFTSLKPAKIAYLIIAESQ